MAAKLTRKCKFSFVCPQTQKTFLRACHWEALRSACLAGLVPLPLPLHPPPTSPVLDEAKSDLREGLTV